MARVLDLFWVFLRLGCVSFGGPVAHLGFVREACVVRRGWMSESSYADLVALCQFLPGPASSQVVYGVGLTRGGLAGAFAAWLGFTLPSAVLMTAAGLGAGLWLDHIPGGLMTGLKLAAVAVVAHAVAGMAVRLCPDTRRKLIAALACGLALGIGHLAGQLAALLAGAVLGFGGRRGTPLSAGDPRKSSTVSAVRIAVPLGLFAVLLGVLPVLAAWTGDLRFMSLDRLYRAGALVFGGGHVVLPWLDTLAVEPGWVSRDLFLAGYGLAQAAPGPLFSFAAFLGAAMSPPMGGVPGAAIGLVAIYLPAWLLVTGVLPVWRRVRSVRGMAAALDGANAAVVGILLAALVNPVGSTAITDVPHAVFAAAAWLVLSFLRIPAWLLVGGCAAAGVWVFAA